MRGRPIAQFRDDAGAAGLGFVFDNGQTAQRYLPDTMSGGAGLFDYDGDGWLDVYCVQGGSLFSPIGPSSHELKSERDALFRNRGDGKFNNVTKSSGIAKLAWGKRYGVGVAVGDYDNDGHTDLFVSRLAAYSLYRNRGDGTLTSGWIA
jgi:hypothetical protein